MKYLRTGARLALSALVLAGFALLVGLGIGPRTGWYRTLTVLSGSMSPSIPVGSVVIATPERPNEVRAGQVIAYQIPLEDHRVVSHRVVKVLSGGEQPVVQTKGDANLAPDPWIARLAPSPVWRVRGAVPGLGWVIIWLRHPVANRVLVLGIPALLAIVWLAEIWRTPARGPSAASMGRGTWMRRRAQGA